MVKIMKANLLVVIVGFVLCFAALSASADVVDVGADGIIVQRAIEGQDEGTLSNSAVKRDLPALATFSFQSSTYDAQNTIRFAPVGTYISTFTTGSCGFGLDVSKNRHTLSAASLPINLASDFSVSFKVRASSTSVVGVFSIGPTCTTGLVVKYSDGSLEVCYGICGGNGIYIDTDTYITVVKKGSTVTQLIQGLQPINITQSAANIDPATSTVVLGSDDSNLCYNALPQSMMIDEVRFYDYAVTHEFVTSEEFYTCDKSKEITKCGHIFTFSNDTISVASITDADSAPDPCISITNSFNATVDGGSLDCSGNYADCSPGMAVYGPGTVTIQNMQFTKTDLSISPVGSPADVIIQDSSFIDAGLITKSPVSVLNNQFNSHNTFSLNADFNIVFNDNKLFDMRTSVAIASHITEVQRNIVYSASSNIFSLMSKDGIFKGNIINGGTGTNLINIAVQSINGNWEIEDNEFRYPQLTEAEEPAALVVSCAGEPYSVQINNNTMTDIFTPACHGIASFIKVHNCSGYSIGLDSNNLANIQPSTAYSDSCARSPVTAGIYISHSTVSLAHNSVSGVTAPANLRRTFSIIQNCFDDLVATALYAFNSQVTVTQDQYSTVTASSGTSCKLCSDASGFRASGVRTCATNGNTVMVNSVTSTIQGIYGGNGANILQARKRDVVFNERGGNAHVFFSSELNTVTLQNAYGKNLFEIIKGGNGGPPHQNADCTGGAALISNMDNFNDPQYYDANFFDAGDDCPVSLDIENCGEYSEAQYTLKTDLNFEIGTCLNFTNAGPIILHGNGKRISCNSQSCDYGIIVQGSGAEIDGISVSGAETGIKATNLTLSDSVVKSSPHCVSARLGANITRSTFQNCSAALTLLLVNSPVVSECRFESSTKGIVATYRGAFKVTQNKFTDMQVSAVELQNVAGATSAEVVGNEVFNSSFMINVFKLNCAPDLLFSYNTVSNVTVTQPQYESDLQEEVAVFNLIASTLKVTSNTISFVKTACAKIVAFMIVLSPSINTSNNIFSSMSVAAGVTCSATPLTIGILTRSTTGVSNNDTISDIVAPAFVSNNFFVANYPSNVALIGVSMTTSSSFGFVNFTATDLSVQNIGVCGACTNGTGLDAYGFFYTAIGGANFGSTITRLSAGNAFQLHETPLQTSAIGGSATVVVSNGFFMNFVKLAATAIKGGDGLFYLATGPYLPVCTGGTPTKSDALVFFDTYTSIPGQACTSSEILYLTSMAWMIPDLHDLKLALAASFSFNSNSNSATAFNFTNAQRITFDGNLYTITCNAVGVDCTPLISFANSTNILVANVKMITPGTGVRAFDNIGGSFAMTKLTIEGSKFGLDFQTTSAVYASFSLNSFINNDVGFGINVPNGFVNFESNTVSGSTSGGSIRTLQANIDGNTIAKFKIYGLQLGLLGPGTNITRNTVSELSGTQLNTFYGMLIKCDSADLVSVMDNVVQNFNATNTRCGSIIGIQFETCKVYALNNLVTNFYVSNHTLTNAFCVPFVGGFRIFNTSSSTISGSIVSNIQLSAFQFVDPTPGEIEPIVFGMILWKSNSGLSITNATISNLNVVDTATCNNCADTSGYSVAAIVGGNAVATITDSVVTKLQAGSAGDSSNAHKGVGGNVFIIYNNNSTFTVTGLSISYIAAGNGGPVTTASPCIGGNVYSSNVNLQIAASTWSDIRNGTGCYAPPTSCIANNCSAKADCINGTGANPFKCVCKSGYQGDGYQCTDINECDQNKCDRHTICSNSDGSYTCTACPVGFNGTGYTRCDPLCGNFICEDTPQYKEDCLSCPYDCKNVTCGVCGDGVCDTAKGESCTTCNADCKSLCAYEPCPGTPTCSGHGNCVLGSCVCTGDYTGPICSTPNRPLNYTANNDSTIILGGSPQVTFKIALRAIQEQDEAKNVITNINMTQTNFTSKGNLNSTILTFNTTLSNQANITITVKTFFNSTKLEFANQTNYLAANTIKLNVKVSNWPFKNIKNMMVFIFDAHDPTTQFDDCKARQDKDAVTGSLKSLIITVNGISMYGQFIEAAYIDGKPRVMTFGLNKDGSVSAFMPHFWQEAEMDPNYSVLLESDTTNNCGEHIKSGAKSVKTTVLIAVLVSVGGVALLGVAAYFLYPKIRLALDVSKAKANAHRGDVKMDESYNTLQESQSVGRL